MQAVAKIIKDMQSKGNNKYSIDMFSDNNYIVDNQQSQRSQRGYEDQDAQDALDVFDSYVKQTKKQKKTDFSNNRKAKRGEL